MRSFENISELLSRQPPELGVKLSRIDVGKGREALFQEQLPQVLRDLAAVTRVASIQASTAIEGFEVPDDRAERIVRQPQVTAFRNRSEAEFAGYRDAVEEMMSRGDAEPVSLPYMLYVDRQLHRHTDGEGGQLKTTQNYIAEFQGEQRHIVFKPVAPALTENALRSLMLGYNEAQDAGAAHSVLLLGLFVLDFLAIHPVDDGNGRLSRLMSASELLRLDYGVVRYVSVEQLIFETKDGYYDALEASQRDWHQARHDPWPWLSYFVSTLHEAYGLFEQKIAASRAPDGLKKTDRVRDYVLNQAGDEFRVADVQKALPGVSTPTIRKVLNELRDDGVLSPGRGPGAKWSRRSDSTG